MENEEIFVAEIKKDKNMVSVLNEAPINNNDNEITIIIIIMMIII